MPSYIRYRTFQPLYPGQPEKQIDGLQPMTTFEELVKKICSKENKDRDTTAHLYLPNGIPLNRNVASESWTLQDWHIKNGDLLLVIFCNAKYNGHDDLCSSVASGNHADYTDGSCTLNIRGLKCCKIQIDQNQDDSMSVYEKVRSATEIPIKWMTLQYNGRDISKSEVPLSEYNLTEFSTLDLILSPQPACPLWYSLFDATNCKPLISQSDAGTSAFYSILFVLSHYIGKDETDLNVLGQLLHLTACPPLVQALAMLFDKRMISIAQRVAISEILYELFKQIESKIPQSKVFEESLKCWTTIFSNSTSAYAISEDYDSSISFFCDSCNCPLHYPFASQTETEMSLCSKCITGDDGNSFKLNEKTAQLMIALPLEDDASFWYMIPNETKWPQPMQPRSTRGTVPIPDYLYVKNPNDLRLRPQNNLPPRLTLNGKNRIVIFTERSKQLERGKTHYFLDPLTGKEHLCDVNMIAHSLQVLATGGNYSRDSYITEPPDEAVLVVLDVSGSMGSRAYPGFTKLDVAKIIFAVFAERIMAFGLKIVVGLSTFTMETTNICKLSEAGETFVSVLTKEAGKLRHGGGTRLWYALEHACRELDEIKWKYPMCIRRVLCLTDGQDGDERQRRSCVQTLCRNNVILDCLLIGDNNPAAKAVALATGGHAFFYSRIEDAISLPDMEAFLSVNLRGDVQRRNAPSEHELSRLQLQQYSSHIPIKVHSMLHSAASFPIPALQAIASQPSLHSYSADCLKHILRGLANIAKSPISGIDVFPIQQDVTYWKVLFSGPADSPYSGGVFILNIHFPKDYPTSPPDIRFETEILHCNVTQDGHICHPMLNRNYYSPDYTMREILKAIHCLLSMPDPIDLADGGRALDYVLDRRTFNDQARRQTQKHASQSAVVLSQMLTGMASPPPADYDDIPHDAWFMIN